MSKIFLGLIISLLMVAPFSYASETIEIDGVKHEKVETNAGPIWVPVNTDNETQNTSDKKKKGRNTNALAGTINKGTFSLGGSTNLSYRTQDFDEFEDRKEFNLFIEGGYFPVNNLEIGLFVANEAYAVGDYDTKYLGFGPTINYYIPINQIVNIYAGLAIGWETYSIDDGNDTWDEDAFSLGVGLGFNIFMNEHVAFNIGVSYWSIEWESDDDWYGNEDETRIYIPRIGIKVYF